MYKSDGVIQDGKIKELTSHIIVDENDEFRCDEGCWYLKNLQVHPTLRSIGLCVIYNVYILNLLRYSGCLEEAK